MIFRQPRAIFGSASNTSSAAPQMMPSCKATSRSSSLTTGPRAVLMRQAVGFIWRKVSSVNRWRVSGVSGTLMLTKSLWRSSSGKDHFLRVEFLGNGRFFTCWPCTKPSYQTPTPHDEPPPRQCAPSPQRPTFCRKHPIPKAAGTSQIFHIFLRA